MDRGEDGLVFSKAVQGEIVETQEKNSGDEPAIYFF